MKKINGPIIIGYALSLMLVAMPFLASAQARVRTDARTDARASATSARASTASVSAVSSATEARAQAGAASDRALAASGRASEIVERSAALNLDLTSRLSGCSAFGHLIAMGWLKNNGTTTTSIGADCVLPPGIARILGNGTTTGTTTQPNLAPVISQITGPTALEAGQTGTWTIVASDPENGALTYRVDWGDGSSGNGFSSSPTFSHAFSTAGDYDVTFTARDSMNARATSTITVNVTATSTATTTATTTLSALNVSLGSTTVAFSWDTNVAADTQVYYATSSPVVIGSASTTATTTSALVTNHDITITGLQASTTHYFILRSTSASGSTASTSEFSLTTL